MSQRSAADHIAWTLERAESYSPAQESYVPPHLRVSGVEARVGALYSLALGVEEHFRFLAFGGQGFVPVTPWAKPGYELCLQAGDIRVKYPAGTTFVLVSSTRGWFSKLQGTGEQWFQFLGCPNVQPWKSAFNNLGKG